MTSTSVNNTLNNDNNVSISEIQSTPKTAGSGNEAAILAARARVIERRNNAKKATGQFTGQLDISVPARVDSVAAVVKPTVVAVQQLTSIDVSVHHFCKNFHVTYANYILCYFIFVMNYQFSSNDI
jgi:hypothetical protein